MSLEVRSRFGLGSKQGSRDVTGDPASPLLLHAGILSTWLPDSHSSSSRPSDPASGQSSNTPSIAGNDVCILVPRTLWVPSVTGLGSTVASRVKFPSLLTLSWDNPPRISGRAQGHHSGPREWRSEGKTLEGCAEKDSPGHHRLSGWKGLWTEDSRRLAEAGRAGRWIVSWSFQKEVGPAGAPAQGPCCCSVV